MRFLVAEFGKSGVFEVSACLIWKIERALESLVGEFGKLGVFEVSACLIWKIERVLKSLVSEFGKLSVLWSLWSPNLEN